MRAVSLDPQDELFPKYQDSKLLLPGSEAYFQHVLSILYAFLSPILFGLLLSLKAEVLESCGGIHRIRLWQLARNYREGDGDCGICFEYAVHSAIRQQNPLVMERIRKALDLCGIRGKRVTSILLGFEKARVLQINNELLNVLTDRSVLITGPFGERVLLKQHIETIQSAFRRRRARKNLPTSMGGIWKSDLLIGSPDTDQWAAASVKINRLLLQSAKGLAIGIVPARYAAEAPLFTKKGMVICPLLADNSFMQFFYAAWRVASAFIKADAHIPPAHKISNGEEFRLAQFLEDHRDAPVLELVAEDLRRLAHPTLLLPQDQIVTTTGVYDSRPGEDSRSILLAPDAILQPQAPKKSRPGRPFLPPSISSSYSYS